MIPGLPNPWIILGVVLTILGAAAGGYLKGHRDADRSAEIETLRTDLAAAQAVAETLKKDAQAARQVADEHKARADQEAALRQSFEEQANAYAQELAAQDATPVPAPVPGSPPVSSRCTCVFDQRDVDRLRDLGAAPADHPAGAPGRAGNLRRTDPAPRAP